MLEWNDNLFLSPGIQDAGEIRQKLEEGKLLPRIYLVTLPSNPANVLDILPALTLLQQTALELCPRIIGIARGRHEALELVKEIIETVYKKTGDFRIAEYLENR